MFCFGLVEGEFKELWLPLLLPGEQADDFASTSSASCCALERRGAFPQGRRFCREHRAQAVTLSSRMCKTLHLELNWIHGAEMSSQAPWALFCFLRLFSMPVPPK